MIGRSHADVNVARKYRWNWRLPRIRHFALRQAKCVREERGGLRSRTEWLGSWSQCKMTVLNLGVFLRLPITFEPPARGNERVQRACAARMRADDSVSGARTCGVGNAWRRCVALDGARNHRRHDDARSFHLKLVLMKFDCLVRQIDHCSERRLNDERERSCSCTRRTRDANAIAVSVDFTLFIRET